MARTPYARHVSTLSTPQSQPIPGRETDMVKNAAGGFAFAIDKWTMLDRFIVLGTSEGTYYATEQALTVDNAKNVLDCIKEDGVRTVDRVVEISHAGRAPKNDPALFVLALAASKGDIATRRHAFASLPKVARIGTHLFHFADMMQGHRGWGRAARRAIGNWYDSQMPAVLANQLIKYRQRDGWTHADLLRLAHGYVDTRASDKRAMFAYALRPDSLRENGTIEVTRKTAGRKDGAVIVKPHAVDEGGETFAPLHPKIVAAAELMKLGKDDAARAVELIVTHDLPRECVPTELLNSPAIWDALMQDMPLGAMVRNLGKMTSIGLIKSASDEATRKVVAALGNVEQIKKARLHPLAILVAQKIYAQGHGDKGSLKWTPVAAVIDALDQAFYASFGAVEPTGKRLLFGLDVSGSMDSGQVCGAPLTPREGVGALAMVSASVESACDFIGFSHQAVTVPISKRMRLDTVCETMRRIPMGGTDCAIPIAYALQRGMKVDAFITMSDGESWAGKEHTMQTLERYRRETGIPAKLVTVDMTATRSSIGDPQDAGVMCVVGMDTAAPGLISDFIRG
jgi:60 kDa SS-A/Ro ribonucleoprotein